MNLGTPIAEGNTSKIYLSDHKIIKVFKDFLPDTESLKEANKQKYASSCGLPVPEVLDVIKVNGKQAIVMEYIRGDTLGDLLFKDKSRAEHYLSISVDMQLAIHSHTASGIEPMYDKLYRQIKEANGLDKRKKSILLKRLGSFTYKPRLCHGDFHLFNLIKENNRVVVIDWVDASAGDIRADVYRSYLLYSEVSSELADMYLQIYCKKSGLLKSEILEWASFIAAARLSESVSSKNMERLLEIVNKSY